MRKNKHLSYLERKERCREIHKWLNASKRLMHLSKIDKRTNIDVPVENDVKMEFEE